MKALSTKTNVEAPSVPYPYGKLKNDTGLFDGTPVDDELLADIVQFFERLMGKSGLVPNGNPDNITNGFQLYQALESLSSDIKYNGSLIINSIAELENNVILPTGAGTTLATFDASSLKKTIEINLSSSWARNISSMGSASVGTEINMSASNGFDFIINATSGTAPNHPIRKTGVSNNDVAFSPDDNQTLKFTKMVDYWQLTEL